jgi:hypothetical protein
MNFDVRLTEFQAERAWTLLVGVGFDVTRRQVAVMTPRELALTLSACSGCKRKTVLELIECVVDTDAA